MAFEASKSEAVHEYVRLLLELHQLIANDRGDSEAADRVRDQMDGPWRKLTPQEIQVLRGLSSDLYSLGANREFSGKISTALDLRIRDSSKAGDLTRTLETIRTYEDELAPVYVAHWRGVCWADLGFLNVAVKFFSEACRLDSEQEFHTYLLIRAMLFSGDLSKAVAISTKILVTGNMAELIYIAATAVFLGTLSLNAERRISSYRAIIDAVEKANRKLSTNSPLVARRDAAIANIWLSISYDQLEMPQQALASARFALQCDPSSATAAKLAGQLEKALAPLSSEEQIAIMSSLMPSMMFGYAAVPYAYAA